MTAIIPKPPEEDEIEASRAPLMEHLIELRKRLMWAMLAILIAFLLCFFFAKHIYNVLVFPYEWASGPDRDIKLIYTAPQEFLITQIKLAFFGAVFIAFPVIANQLWKFVAPGLLEHEKKYTVPFLVGSATLFYGGGAIFYLVLPFVLHFLLSFAKGDIKAQLSVGYYVTFCVRLMIAFGLVFQLPMVVVFLTQLGLVSSRLLVKHCRHAVVLMFVVAAVLTPTTDPVSLLALVLPMLLLYGLSILAAKGVELRQA